MYPPYQNQNPNRQPPNSEEGWYGNPNQQAQSQIPQSFPVAFALNQMNMSNVSPELVNASITVGQDMFKKQADRFGISSTGLSLMLKYYFQVDNTYVRNKIYRILYPVQKLSWNRHSAEDYAKDTVTANYSSKWAVPSNDENGPDLYIPLMSFVTYVLLYGLCRASSITNFTPEIIIQAIWRGLALQLVESFVIKFGVNMMSVTLPFLDVFSYTGYKYVGLCLNLVSRLFGHHVSFIVSLYTASMLGYFVMKTLAGVVPEYAVMSTGWPPRHTLLFGFAAMQFLIVLVLSWWM